MKETHKKLYSGNIKNKEKEALKIMSLFQTTVIANGGLFL